MKFLLYLFMALTLEKWRTLMLTFRFEKAGAGQQMSVLFSARISNKKLLNPFNEIFTEE